MAVRPATRERAGSTFDSGIALGHDVVLITNAGGPTNGATGANRAGKGSLCVDYTNGKLYINTGTKASPTWTVAGTQS